MASDNTHDDAKLAPANDIPEPNPRNVRLLKTVVTVLGVLLIVGTVVLVTAIIYKASKLKSGPAVKGYKLETLLPQGATVVDTDLDGDRALVRIRNGATEQLIIYNLRKGREAGRITLKPASN